MPISSRKVRLGGDVVLSPLTVSKVACGVMSPVAAFFAAALVIDPPIPVLSQAGAAPLVVFAVVVLFRSPRLRVQCDSRGVTVHGILWSRTIPRRSVTAVTDTPSIIWLDGRGRRRRTPMTFLPISGRALGFVLRHNERQIDRLRRWTR